MKRFDLHCHTTCSDGTMSPEELILHAKERGLWGISITDHDTIKAYDTAIEVAQSHHVFLGSGVEFSSMNDRVSVHVLGYDIDLKNSALNAFCKRHIDRRKERNQRIIEKLGRLGMKVEIEEKEGYPGGRPHIALALVEKGYATSVQDAFHRFIGDGKPCFDPGVPMTTDETIDIIHQAGGKAFLAHPHLLKASYSPILKKPFDGIECYYSKCNPQQEEKWVRIVKEKGLLMSGGSDFHGTIKPNIPLGCSWVDEETFNTIFENHQWN